MCAVCKVKHWSPRKTQVVGLIILILTGCEHSNRLLEMQTGEGKSCLVALYAVVLCIQNKKVDVVTSSPVLALRDVEIGRHFTTYLTSQSHTTLIWKGILMPTWTTSREIAINTILFMAQWEIFVPIFSAKSFSRRK